LLLKRRVSIAERERNSNSKKGSIEKRNHPVESNRPKDRGDNPRILCPVSQNLKKKEEPSCRRKRGSLLGK